MCHSFIAQSAGFSPISRLAASQQAQYVVLRIPQLCGNHVQPAGLAPSVVLQTAS